MQSTEPGAAPPGCGILQLHPRHHTLNLGCSSVTGVITTELLNSKRPCM